MRITRLIHVTGCAALLAGSIGMGCDGSTANTGTPGTPGTDGTPGTPTDVAQTTGYMLMHTTSRTNADYKAVNVNVLSVDVQTDAGAWITVATPKRIINLLDLDVEARALIDVQAALRVGHYNKLRLHLGDGCTVVLGDGTSHELRIPTELRAGLLVDVDLNVKADATLDLFLNFDLTSCIQLVMQDKVPCYYLRPIVDVVDQALTGEISGTLRAKLTGQVQANVELFAEMFDELGRPHIVATTRTDLQGHYKFDSLPFGKRYHIVCVPSRFDKLLKTYASVELELDASVPSRSLDIDLELDLDLNLNLLGTVQGKVTPVVSLDGCDKVDLVAQLSCGAGCNKWFVVASAAAWVDGDEGYSFKALSRGHYGIQSRRGRCVAGGTCSWSPVWVGGTADIDLSLNLSIILGINL